MRCQNFILSAENKPCHFIKKTSKAEINKEQEKLKRFYDIFFVVIKNSLYTNFLQKHWTEKN